MEKIEKVDVCCNVCSCVHNIDGCTCAKQGIKISKGDENSKAHYCESYENNCGFRN